MGIILLPIGVLLLALAVGMSNFFKFIIWAGACVALYYGMQAADILNEESPLGSALFFIGGIQIALTVFEIKVFGITIARGISDIVLHIIGIIMLIVGIII